jgi:orotate phosphoribosyltransferase
MTTTKQQLIDLINERKVVTAESVTTSAGDKTTTYLEIPSVLCDGHALRLAVEVLFSHLVEDGRPMNANMVVGPMAGAIPLVVGLAAYDHMPADTEWSIIRDKVKDHGLGSAFVGAEPGPGDKVVLVDDVASSGESLIEAWEEVAATGAEILAVVPLVDRGDRAAQLFTADDSVGRIAIPYLPVLTYKDLGLEAL